MTVADARHVVLVGMMGAGKTTVGHRLAARLRRRMVDSDELIEARTGRTVREIFEHDGEPAFRVLETAALVEALGDPEPLVVAAAGGVLMRPENREALRRSGSLVVWLRADPAVLAARATRGAHRPLLDGDPDAAMRRLLPEREPLYREAADVVIDTDALDADEIADRIVEVVSGIRRITVPLGARAYDVVVGHGAVAALAGLLPATTRRAAIVSQATVPFAVDLPVATSRLEIGDGEPAKTLATIEMLSRGFAQLGLTRNDVVIGVGGGMVTDVAGFAAATWHRGVPVVHVATTLLGMVDAAIGGKTGVNLPEGKNLVGAFWQPVGVVCDLDALATLPPRERRSGDGEMAKYHFLTGDDLDAMSLTDRVARCVEIKAAVVASDAREGGRRALLNYGHTLAHALETATEHRIAHGEAVAVGLIFAAQLANVLDRVDAGRVDEHFAVVGEEYGLATDLPAGLVADRLVDL
ncbi:MAG TPA: bifunctional shikimate kinase/3-dehydroquinate synthase, partial [Ilumatobacteraceae bacterium]|nr:bifunctional shikimate kinase/3-dehydroquinate synthase [Ilumatobacteraceae bacterium]